MLDHTTNEIQNMRFTIPELPRVRYRMSVLDALYKRLGYMLEQYGEIAVAEHHIRLPMDGAFSLVDPNAGFAAFGTKLSDYMRQQGVDHHYLWAKQDVSPFSGPYYVFIMIVPLSDEGTTSNLHTANTAELLDQELGMAMVESTESVHVEQVPVFPGSTSSHTVCNPSNYEVIMAALKTLSRIALTHSVDDGSEGTAGVGWSPTPYRLV